MKRILKNLFETRPRSSRLSAASFHILERRFQALLVLALFMPTVLTALSGSADVLNKSVLSWTAVIAILIGTYVLIELLGQNMSSWVGKLCDVLVLVNISLYIPLLYIIAQYKDFLPFIPGIFFAAILLSVMFIPVAVLSILIFNAFFLGVDWAERKVNS